MAWRCLTGTQGDLGEAESSKVDHYSHWLLAEVPPHSPWPAEEACREGWTKIRKANIVAFAFR